MKKGGYFKSRLKAIDVAKHRGDACDFMTAW